MTHLEALKKSTKHKEAFAYDKAGNRWADRNEWKYKYNSANQLIKTSKLAYSYDMNGNLLQVTSDKSPVTSYKYNSENQLIEVNVSPTNHYPLTTISFSYDALGRRISKSVSSPLSPKPSTLSFIYDNDNIIAILDGNNNLVATFVHGPNTDEPLIMSNHHPEGGCDTSGADTSNDSCGVDSITNYFYHSDALGSVNFITDEKGKIIESYKYKVYGKPTIKDSKNETLSASSIGNPFLFTSREYESETGLYYYRARYYNPDIGRFLQEDPISFSGGNTNLYVYVSNNPINLRDPKGLLFENWGDPKKRADNISSAITLDKFLLYAKDKSLSEVQTEYQKGKHGFYSAGGPNYRYVINPLNSKEVIDMRHFLVVGQFNELFGLGVEMVQLATDPQSAFNPQDFLSNYLGTKFYSSYDKNLSWRVNLMEFFNKEKNKCQLKKS
ncbi:MAG: RHS repeat-associated core domain-containing protein [Elusimicrobiota bacterium]|nr:RHS repeat-associated core domain-containing protein [Elusimicrobiota bacterium]